MFTTTYRCQAHLPNGREHPRQRVPRALPVRHRPPPHPLRARRILRDINRPGRVRVAHEILIPVVLERHGLLDAGARLVGVQILWVGVLGVELPFLGHLEGVTLRAFIHAELGRTSPERGVADPGAGWARALGVFNEVLEAVVLTHRGGSELLPLRQGGIVGKVGGGGWATVYPEIHLVERGGARPRPRRA